MTTQRPTLAIFTDSTPAPLLDGTIPKPWRVAHADRLRDLLASLGYRSRQAYVEYGSGSSKAPKRLWVGLRDNRDRMAHAVDLVCLQGVLVALGLTVKVERRSWGVSGLWVVDSNVSSKEP